MQPTLCSRCHKNVAVIFIPEAWRAGPPKARGLCLKCAKEMDQAREDMMQKMGISDEDLEA